MTYLAPTGIAQLRYMLFVKLSYMTSSGDQASENSRGADDTNVDQMVILHNISCSMNAYDNGGAMRNHPLKVDIRLQVYAGHLAWA